MRGAALVIVMLCAALATGCGKHDPFDLSNGFTRTAQSPFEAKWFKASCAITLSRVWVVPLLSHPAWASNGNPR